MGDGEVLARIALPVGGLMLPETAAAMARPAATFRQAIGTLGLDPTCRLIQ